ncbi:MAG: prephenate dehydrogenase/arogenate dehydrogenase family protein [Dethiobacteraceae bacterium]|nr:prephenate dehydrogenase [Bacillota bacterium]
MFPLRRVAILGVGMMGGSLGKALLKRDLAVEVIGYDADPAAVQLARQVGAVTHAAATAAEAVAAAELVVLAVPVQAACRLLREMAPYLSPGCLVTDLCSTKAAVTKAAEEALPAAAAFVGGHPMAGSEKTGVLAAEADLFENAIYILTGTASAELTAMQDLVWRLGGLPVVMTPEQHDRQVAAISHLPHLTAAVLVQTVAGLGETAELLSLAGGGFRDSTRIALGCPRMWKDICLSNRDNLLTMLDMFADRLSEVRQLVAQADAAGLLAYFAAAREVRQQVPLRGKGLLPLLYNLFVFVPDRPGLIGEVTGLLGEGGINIAEIELLRVREKTGGPLRLGFVTAAARDAAAEILQTAGLRVERQEE